MLLIGSRALAFWSSNFKIKEGADWDVIAYPHESDTGIPNIEYHDPGFLNNHQAESLFGSGVYYNGFEVCNPLGLLLIKRSHLWRDYKFDSHITQYHKFLMPLVEGVCPSLEEQMFYENRLAQTKKEFPQGNPKLNKLNEEFFDDAVPKVYDHDWLHELYAHEEKPMYMKLKRKGKESLAWCEKDLWNGLSQWEKNVCVAEEAYVISTERFLIPSDWQGHPRISFLNAMRKICTTLCSGWFRDHAIDYYPEIVDLYNLDKINKVRSILEGITK